MKISTELQTTIDAGKIKIPTYEGALAKALNEGHLRLDIGQVKATVEKKEASMLYIKMIPTGSGWLNGALALVDGDTTKVSGLFWYGYDLGVRNTHRPALVASLEGPAKIMARTAKDLVAAGLADTYEEAMQAVVDGRKKKGLPV